MTRLTEAETLIGLYELISEIPWSVGTWEAIASALVPMSEACAALAHHPSQEGMWETTWDDKHDDRLTAIFNMLPVHHVGKGGWTPLAIADCGGTWFINGTSDWDEVTCGECLKRLPVLVAAMEHERESALMSLRIAIERCIASQTPPETIREMLETSIQEDENLP